MSNAELSDIREGTLSAGRAIYDAYRRRGQRLSIATLERLLYLCQGWSLACTGSALIDETFFVEAHGPVLYSLAPLRRRYGRDDLPMHDGDAIFGSACIPYGDDITKIEVIQRTIARYGCFTSSKIGEITRMAGGAFERALIADERCLRISEIRADFVALGRAGRATTAQESAA